ncbi:ABC transporter, ATP-binding protein [Actinomycetales bacterium JB111]|nr:ABC transporter, ATP-binding protein [Actinomycetales bacterium JB111]
MGVLELQNLNKSYGRIRALKDMSFTVGSGELFGFVGSNGAGKTTTMRIVLGVLAADSGSVTYDGKPLDLDLRRRVGYMPEERGLYPKMKVGDQLRFLARLHGLSAADAASATDRWTERLGVASRRGDDVESLSLGNQQRVQLAAALVHEPEVLVLDEPFSGLDPVAVDVMSDVLKERAAAGVPVIFSSHQLDLVERLCHRVGIVSAGSMVAIGTIDELRTVDQPVWRIVVGADNVDLAPVASAVPGAVAESVEAGAGKSAVQVMLPDEQPGAEQALLSAAAGIGPVVEFGAVRPQLADLFRDVVSDGGASEDDRAKKREEEKQAAGSRSRGGLFGRRKGAER